MTKDDGGPAFPKHDRQEYGEGYRDFGSDGMSLRDWFAGQALAGGAKNLVVCPASQVARLAYEVADAMLEAHKRD